jgi:hypothetical protein
MVEAPKNYFNGLTMMSRSVSSHIKYILLALEKNVFLGHSKPVSPNMEPSHHWSGLPTGSLVVITGRKKILTCT